MQKMVLIKKKYFSWHAEYFYRGGGTHPLNTSPLKRLFFCYALPYIKKVLLTFPQRLNKNNVIVILFSQCVPG